MVLLKTTFGVIAVLDNNSSHCDDYQVLLVRNNRNEWSFIKNGYTEIGEIPILTVKRVLKEKTGLDVERWYHDQPLHEQYEYKRQEDDLTVFKTTDYYIASINNTTANNSDSIILNQDNYIEYRWVTLKDAPSILTFEGSKQLCNQLKDIINIKNQ